jgi:hypothetical protein
MLLLAEFGCRPVLWPWCKLLCHFWDRLVLSVATHCLLVPSQLSCNRLVLVLLAGAVVSWPCSLVPECILLWCLLWGVRNLWVGSLNVFGAEWL